MTLVEMHERERFWAAQGCKEVADLYDEAIRMQTAIDRAQGYLANRVSCDNPVARAVLEILG